MEWSHCWPSVAQEHYGDSESCGLVAASGAAKKHGEGVWVLSFVPRSLRMTALTAVKPRSFSEAYWGWKSRNGPEAATWRRRPMEKLNLLCSLAERSCAYYWKWRNVKMQNNLHLEEVNSQLQFGCKCWRIWRTRYLLVVLECYYHRCLQMKCIIPWPYITFNCNFNNSVLRYVKIYAICMHQALW